MDLVFATSIGGVFVLLMGVLFLIYLRADAIPGKKPIIIVVVLAGSIIGIVGIAAAAATQKIIDPTAFAAILGAAIGAFGAKALDSVIDSSGK